MRKIMKKTFLIMLSAVMLLPLCACFVPDGPTKDGLPYEGHYLIDLYKPYDATRDKHSPGDFSYAIDTFKTVTMAGEEFHKGIRFSDSAWDGMHMYYDYEIGGKYENISFFYGMDNATKWQADNVAFQVKNPDTGDIIWEDLFEIGDIPRFVTVNIKGMERIRLECYKPYCGTFCMADITLWEGESQAIDRSYPVVTDSTMLEDNYKFYYSAGTYTLNTSVWNNRNFGESDWKNSIKGEPFEHSALIDFGSDGGDDLYMNLRGQFKQISFYFGMADEQNTVSANFKGWVSIYADGKCLIDEYICTTETPARTIVLDVDYAWQLRIVTRSNAMYDARYCLAKLQGGENLGEQTENDRRFTEPVSMIRTYPPYFLETVFADSKVLNSASRYHFFSMGGNKYCEGIVLQPVWNLLFGDEEAAPAYVVADLEGEQKYLSFTLGHVDTSPYKDAIVEIYLNDEEKPSYTFELDATALPKDYVIDVKNCHTIKFLCTSVKANNLPTVGIANIVAYPDEVVENEVFRPYYKEYPEECELLDYFLPFGYYSCNIEKPYYLDEIEDVGMYFKTCDGVEQKKGLLFCTNYQMIDWDYVGLFDVLAMGTIGAIIPGAQSVDKNSYFFFNLNGEYDTLTFKTAKVEKISTQGLPTYIHAADPDCEAYSQVINVYGDDSSASIYSCDLIDGTVQEHTVDVSGVKRLIICIPSNGHLISEVYSAFDLKVSKTAD